jgi:FkbM family methyltransferase
MPPKIVNLPYGVFSVLENAHHDHVQRTIASGNIWEPEIISLCEKYVIPGSTVVDIGANLGAFAVRLSQLVGKSGKVFSFEPQRIIHQQLCCNIFLNDIRNVFTYQMALAEKEKTVHLTPINYDNGAPGEVRIHGNEGEEVICKPLDFYNLSNVSLIKIDAERYEPFIFDGAQNTIKNNRPVILFELTTLPLPDYPTNFIYNMLHDMNYNVYLVSEKSGDYCAIPIEKDTIPNV